MSILLSAVFNSKILLSCHQSNIIYFKIIFLFKGSNKEKRETDSQKSSIEFSVWFYCSGSYINPWACWLPKRISCIFISKKFCTCKKKKTYVDICFFLSHHIISDLFSNLSPSLFSWNIFILNLQEKFFLEKFETLPILLFTSNLQKRQDIQNHQ